MSKKIKKNTKTIKTIDFSLRTNSFSFSFNLLKKITITTLILLMMTSNWSSAPSNLEISINQDNELTNNTIVNLTLSADDATHMKFSCDGINWSGIIAYAQSSQFNIVNGAGCDSNEGIKTVYFSARDINGEFVSVPATDDINYDITPPIIEYVNHDANQINSLSYLDGDNNVLITLKGEIGGTAYFTLGNVTDLNLYDNGTYGDVTADDGIYSRSWGFKNQTITKQYLVGKLIDDAGNETTKNSSTEIGVDSTEPNITIISPENNGYAGNENPTITFELYDETSGIKINELNLWVQKTKIENTNISAVEITNGYRVVYTTEEEFQNEENITIDAKITNQANIENDFNWTINIDLNEPTPPTNIRVEKITGKNDLNVVWGEASDVISGIKNYKIYRYLEDLGNPGQLINNNITPKIGDNNYYDDLNAELEGKLIYYGIVAEDLAGNESEEVYSEGTKSNQTIGPTNVSLIIQDNNGYTKDINVGFSITATNFYSVRLSCGTDANKTKEYTTQTITDFNYLNPYYGCNKNQGEKTIYAFVKDQSGNEVRVSDKTYYDITPPAKITTLRAVKQDTGEIRLIWDEVKDKEGYIYQYVLYQGIDENVTNEDKNRLISFPTTRYSFYPSNKTRYYFKVAAMDHAENVSVLSNEIYVYSESQIPIITIDTNAPYKNEIYYLKKGNYEMIIEIGKKIKKITAKLIQNNQTKNLITEIIEEGNKAKIKIEIKEEKILNQTAELVIDVKDELDISSKKIQDIIIDLNAPIAKIINIDMNKINQIIINTKATSAENTELKIKNQTETWELKLEKETINTEEDLNSGKEKYILNAEEIEFKELIIEYTAKDFAGNQNIAKKTIIIENDKTNSYSNIEKAETAKKDLEIIINNIQNMGEDAPETMKEYYEIGIENIIEAKSEYSKQNWEKTNEKTNEAIQNFEIAKKLQPMISINKEIEKDYDLNKTATINEIKKYLQEEIQEETSGIMQKLSIKKYIQQTTIENNNKLTETIKIILKIKNTSGKEITNITLIDTIPNIINGKELKFSKPITKINDSVYEYEIKKIENQQEIIIVTTINQNLTQEEITRMSEEIEKTIKPPIIVKSESKEKVLTENLNQSAFPMEIIFIIILILGIGYLAFNYLKNRKGEIQ